jgi:hypothetical protein
MEVSASVALYILGVYRVFCTRATYIVESLPHNIVNLFQCRVYRCRKGSHVDKIKRKQRAVRKLGEAGHVFKGRTTSAYLLRPVSNPLSDLGHDRGRVRDIMTRGEAR